MTRKLRTGSRIGKYRVEKLLGEGGSASVWKARDTIEGRRVALKVMRPEVIEEFGPSAIEGEARLAARLDHPRVVGIRNADWIDGHFVIVVDLARWSLDQYSASKRSPALALTILCDVAEGLAYAHQRRLLHRDIKPANIFLFEDRRAKLGDFGTARIAPAATRLLTEVGTFGYMAPEQAYGRPRLASDVFSLALTGYEMWSGVLPGWPFEWPLEGAARFEKQCPGAVQPVIRRALNLDLKKRFSDGVEFHRALVRAVERAEREKANSRKRKSPRSARKNSTPDPFELEMKWFRKRYARVFDTRFDCHACSGPISESMRYCPWCGTSSNSFAEVTSYPLICPDCERGVRAEWSACPKCSTGRFVSNGRPIRADRNTERKCRRPGCGTPLQRFMKYCPACKFKVSRPWKVEGVDPCTRCSWPMAPRWRFCGWCGRKDRRALDVSIGRRTR